MSLEETLRQIIREELRAVLLERRPTTPAGLLTLDEAAAHAKCSKATLHKWLRDGLLTRHGKGKLTRVECAQVDAALAGNGRKTQARDPASVGLALARGH